jgi:hypothetical protein
MGDLSIDSVAGGTIELDRGDSVNAAQSIESLMPVELVGVPESQMSLSLLCGALGLQLLRRRRSRTAK